jgi:hypothetical protein
MTFSRYGRKITGWVVILAAVFTAWMWIASKPEPERSIWWLAVGFGITLTVAMDAHARAIDLQRRVERLERNL